ncbi:MAG: acyltransferase domain-containing protein [Planctomycetota bacterium]|nr:acyltransferase domain-containing protein [Planctomycetota bacterium]
MNAAVNLADPEAVFAALELGEAYAPWKATWAKSQPDFPAGGISWLSDGFVAEACRTLKMRTDAAEAYRAGAAWLRGNAPASRLAWHGHYLLFKAPREELTTTGRWQLPPGALGEASALFLGLVLLSGHTLVRERHAARGIPEAITLDTLSDLELWTHEYRRKHGRWGFNTWGWLRLHFTCDLFKLGRLQFNFGRCHFHMHAFRHKATRRVLVMAEDGQRFRADGQYWNADGREATDGVWTSRFECDGKVMRGNRITARGAAVREPLELPVAEWTKVFGRDDTSLGIHIAATGPMDHGECGESMRQAVEFFPKHFPEFRLTGFTCSSWLLDRQFEDHLPAHSNIVRFLQEYHLLPYPKASDGQHMERVFDGPIEDLEKAPQDSSLRRAMVKFMKEGGHWRSMGCIYLPEDLAWGTQVYRKMEAGQ